MSPGSHSARLIAVTWPATRADVPAAAAAISAQLVGMQGRTVLCDVADAPVALRTVDLLARLQLAALRQQCHVILVGPSPGMRDLLRIVGLDFVIAPRGIVEE